MKTLQKHFGIQIPILMMYLFVVLLTVWVYILTVRIDALQKKQIENEEKIKALSDVLFIEIADEEEIKKRRK